MIDLKILNIWPKEVLELLIKQLGQMDLYNIGIILAALIKGIGRIPYPIPPISQSQSHLSHPICQNPIPIPYPNPLSLIPYPLSLIPIPYPFDLLFFFIIKKNFLLYKYTNFIINKYLEIKN